MNAPDTVRAPRDVLAHPEVMVARRGPHDGAPAGMDVLYDPTLSLGARLALVLLELRPAVGRSGLTELRRSLGVKRAFVLAYLDELYRRDLIDIEAPS